MKRWTPILAAALVLTALGCAKVDAPTETLSPYANVLLIDRDGLQALGETELADQLEADPYAYFRFVNKQWSTCVCALLQDELSGSPIVGLHGDAHLGQYAFTATSHGLDDFDDSVRGPAALDLIRFLSSVELVLQRRGWEEEWDHQVAAFFDGYREGLSNPDNPPPAPGYVKRVRAQIDADPQAFLKWAESLMIPFTPEEQELFDIGQQKLAEMMNQHQPDLPDHFFNVKKAGVLRMGVGSALTPKRLARVEGLRMGPEDDFIMEAKRLSDLSGISCLELPETGEAFRVISGTRRIGRLEHGILAVMPRIPGTSGDSEWWVRSWEPTYRELDVDDLRDPAELAEIIRDVGVQLGNGHRANEIGGEEDQGAALEQFLDRRQGALVQLSQRMTGHLLEAWTAYRAGGTD